MVETVGAILCDGESVLLGLRASHRTFPGCWDLIGGHVAAGETPWEALWRELLEEIGVAEARGTFLETLTVGGVPLHLHVVSGWCGVPSIRNDEHDELRWFALSAAADLPNLASSEYRRTFITLQTSWAQVDPAPRPG